MMLAFCTPSAVIIAVQQRPGGFYIETADGARYTIYDAREIRRGVKVRACFTPSYPGDISTPQVAPQQVLIMNNRVIGHIESYPMGGFMPREKPGDYAVINASGALAHTRCFLQASRSATRVAALRASRPRLHARLPERMVQARSGWTLSNRSGRGCSCA
jgi:hypothetical protein